MRVIKLHWSTVCGGLLVLILVCTPIFFDLPGNLLLVRALQNSGHAVLFCAIALLVCALGLRPYFLVLVACIAVGASIEVIQSFTGRDCSLGDVYLDALGAIAGLSLFEAVQSRRPRWLALTAALLLLVLYLPLQIAWAYVQAARQFPVLCDFDGVGVAKLIGVNEGLRVALVPAPASWQGNHSLVAKLTFPSTGWPGLVLRDLPRDWTGFQTLQVDVWSEQAEPVTLSIALRSWQNHSDHQDASQTFVVVPGFNRVRLPLSDWRLIQTDGYALLANVWQVILFTGHSPRAQQLYVDNLRLLPE